jgi:hypothetical protein
VITEALKHFENNGIHAPLMFFRDQTGNEIDLLVPRGARYQAVEIKSGQTLSPSWLDRLKWFRKTFAEETLDPSLLVHPRSEEQVRRDTTVTSHEQFATHLPRKRKQEPL